MAERYLFFNSTVNDPRTYQAQDFADYFGSVLSTGLLHTDEVPGMNVTVEQGTLNTMVSPGKAIMRGHLYENTTPLQLTHSIPEPTVDRIDRIVLRLDLRHMYRNILLRVKEGMPAEVPEPPTLQRDEFIYEISLAQIKVRANTVQLYPEDLIDERLDEELCGLVHSLISIPTDQFNSLLQQMQDEWDDWFSQQQTEGFVLQSEKGQPGGVAKQDDFALHLAESAQQAHLAKNIGFSNAEMTATNVEEGILEAFMLGNSTKEELVDKLLLVDDSLPIDYTSTWSEILLAIEMITTGKKWASGDANNIQGTSIIVDDLQFKPNVVWVYSTSTFSGVEFFILFGSELNPSYSANLTGFHTRGTVGSSGVWDILNSRALLSGDGENEITDDGFIVTGIPFDGTYNSYIGRPGYDFHWIAFE